MLTASHGSVASISMHQQRLKVLVYTGEGAGWRSVRSACESLQCLLAPRYKVSTLTTSELLSSDWATTAALLVMPGGADLPYCKHLNGKGNAIIRDFVERGGGYLGLCAGAYYACSRVEFEPSSSLAVFGDRELAFFPGIARGAAFPGFDYATEAGAVAADLEFQVPAALAEPDSDLQLALQQVQGGQQAITNRDRQYQQLQQQQQQQPGMSVQPICGQQSSSWCSTVDYCNGGPFFMAHGGSFGLQDLPGVKVLAWYSHLPPRAAGEQLQQPQQEPQAHQQQQQPVQCSQGSQQQQQQQPRLHQEQQVQHHLLQQQQYQQDNQQRQQHQEQLQQQHIHSSSLTAVAAVSHWHYHQRYMQQPHGGILPAAAVRIKVGLGVAVLCGTHPELGPHWLDTCGEAREGPRGLSSAASSSGHSGAGAVNVGTPTPLAAATTGHVGGVVDSNGTRQQGCCAAVSKGGNTAAADSAAADGMASKQHQQQQSGKGQQQQEVGSQNGCAEPVVSGSCAGAGLTAHVEALRGKLTACQQQRDLFLSCLLYEVLRRPRHR